MKLIKHFLGIMAFIVVPFCGMALADDCFDTVIAEDGEILYIDPNDKYSVFDDRENLVSIYGDKLECSGSKKEYSSDEYMDLLFDDFMEAYSKKQSHQSSRLTIFEIIWGIMGVVAMWKIFTKAGKSGIASIIPIYNCYEMSDIAGMSGLFKKAFLCLIVGFGMIFISLFIFPIALFPQIGLILIYVFGIYMCVVNYNIARNFGWSVVASVLYVIFNPIAILFLAFGHDKYYMSEQKSNLENKIKEMELKNLVAQGIKDKENMNQNVGGIKEEMDYDNLPKEEEIKIKYIDPDKISGVKISGKIDNS